MFQCLTKESGSINDLMIEDPALLSLIEKGMDADSEMDSEDSDFDSDSISLLNVVKVSGLIMGQAVF